MNDNNKKSINYDVDERKEEELDLNEIWRIIRSYRKSIIAIFVLTLLLTAYITITTPSVYQATSSVIIKDGRADASTLLFGVSTTKQRLQNEIEILNSYNLHNIVIQSLIDDGSAENLALFGTRYVRTRYRLMTYFLHRLSKAPATSFEYFELSDQSRIKIVNKLRRSTQISTVKDADILKISVSSVDSSEAVLLSNRISTTYRDLDIAGGQGELRFVLKFLDSQITKYENRLEVVENDLKAFQMDSKIFSLDGSAQILLKDLAYYEGIYYTNMADLEVAQARVKYLKDQLTRSEKLLIDEITNTNNPMIISLRGKIADLEAQRVQQMVDEGWGSGSMQARDFDRRISDMKVQLKKVTESLILSGWSEEDPFEASQEIFNKIVEQEVEVHAAKSRSSEYKKLVDQMSERLSQLPSQTLQYARLEREVKLNENLYITMKQKYEESRITEAGTIGKVRILDPSLVANKIKPSKKKNAILGVIIGLSLGIGYALTREFLDNTVKAVEQLERKGLTVLGIIPDMHHDSSGSTKKYDRKASKGGENFRRRLITYEDPKSPVSESYRSLRTNISYSSSEKKIKSLLISSPQPGEGKSTTTANLAIAFAQLKRKTLLVDADLRKPVQHNVFGQPRDPGLSEYLIGEINEFDSIIHKTQIENLFVVSAGAVPPNPSELLGSARMGRIIDELESKWDIVLFDSPPIVAVTDASMISNEIDAIALVVKAGSTDKAAVDRALDTINNVNAPLIGAILNSANPETLAGKYSYYYSYYNHYYNSSNEK